MESGRRESFLKENPEVVKAFVRATLRGYQYAFKNPQEAAELIQKHAKALNNQITVEELKIVEDLAVTPEVKKNGIGSFTPARMETSVAWMVENGGFSPEKAPKPQDVYATGFMPAQAGAALTDLNARNCRGRGRHQGNRSGRRAEQRSLRSDAWSM